MASIVCMSHAVGFINTTKTSSCSSFVYNKQRRLVVVRAESINPDIRKTEDKVVDAVVVTELSKPLTAYCRFLLFLTLICMANCINKFYVLHGKLNLFLEYLKFLTFALHWYVGSIRKLPLNPGGLGNIQYPYLST
ncbi:hypothetical protein LIER_40135 [Lithospermum erythrorhizon]|uniref:Uncharacterized protein n=1 Tax=Lithospermum erythrorhizon TaxID=34254 RepID=A0AAV3QT45_LITER